METTAHTRDRGRAVTVVVVDDQTVFRRVACDVVAATPGFEAIGEAASGEEAVRLVADVAPALVLLDIRMPGMDGLETATRIAAAASDSVVVLITGQDLGELAARAAHSGATTIARKQDLSPRMLQQLWDAHGPPPRARDAGAR